MPVFPGTAISGPAPRVQEKYKSPAESPIGARFRQARGDTAGWPADDFEVYWDLARVVPVPALGPGQTR